MPYKKKEGYSVGYKKPPAETRFKKGQSGNKSGKRKMPAEISSLLEVLERPVKVTENGRTRKVPLMAALMTHWVKRAFEDVDAAKLVLGMAYNFEKRRPVVPTAFERAADQQKKNELVDKLNDLLKRSTKMKRLLYVQSLKERVLETPDRLSDLTLGLREEEREDIERAVKEHLSKRKRDDQV